MVKEFDKEIKNKLPKGVWQEEPDYQHWVDEETKLDCLIVRQPSGGHLCGYIGVSKDHPLYGIEYNDCSLAEARTPNAEEVAQHHIEQMKFYTEQLKYDEDKALKSMEVLDVFWLKRKRCSKEWCDHTPESIFNVHGGLTYSAECHGKICHKTDDGDHVWWFGFDCAHSGDLSPGYQALTSGYREIMDRQQYKHINYVMEECKSLAKQLKEYEIENKVNTDSI